MPADSWPGPRATRLNRCAVGRNLKCSMGGVVLLMHNTARSAVHDLCRPICITPGPCTATGDRRDAPGARIRIFRRMRCVAALAPFSAAGRNPDLFFDATTSRHAIDRGPRFFQSGSALLSVCRSPGPMDNDRLPPLNSLKAFEAAARHESFLEAATEHGVTPGSVCRHVRLLERYLGSGLLVRRSNGITLTSAGKDYAGRVRDRFRDLRAETDRVRKPGRERAIVISTLPIFLERWLCSRIPSFRKTFGRADLRIEAHNGEHDTNREDVCRCVDHVFERTAPRLQRRVAVRRRGLSRLQSAVAKDAVDPARCRRGRCAAPAARHLLGYRLAGLRALSARPSASLPPTCALRSARASSRRRSTAWG